MINIDFQALRNIIRDKSNKSKNSIESVVCLREFLKSLCFVIDCVTLCEGNIPIGLLPSFFYCKVAICFR